MAAILQGVKNEDLKVTHLIQKKPWNLGI